LSAPSAPLPRGAFGDSARQRVFELLPHVGPPRYRAAPPRHRQGRGCRGIALWTPRRPRQSRRHRRSPGDAAPPSDPENSRLNQRLQTGDQSRDISFRHAWAIARARLVSESGVPDLSPLPNATIASVMSWFSTMPMTPQYSAQNRSTLRTDGAGAVVGAVESLPWTAMTAATSTASSHHFSFRSRNGRAASIAWFRVNWYVPASRPTRVTVTPAIFNQCSMALDPSAGMTRLQCEVRPHADVRGPDCS